MNGHTLLLGLLTASLPLSWGWTILKGMEMSALRKKIRAWDPNWKKQWEIEHRFPFEFLLRDIQLQLKRSTWSRRWLTFSMVILLLCGAGMIVNHSFYHPFLSNEQVLGLVWMLSLIVLGLVIPGIVYFELEKNVSREKLFQINNILYREKYDLAEMKRLEMEQKKFIPFELVTREQAPQEMPAAVTLEPQPSVVPGDSPEAAAASAEAAQALFPDLEEIPVAQGAKLVDSLKEMGPDSAAQAIKTFLSQDQAKA